VNRYRDLIVRGYEATRWTFTLYGGTDERQGDDAAGDG